MATEATAKKGMGLAALLGGSPKPTPMAAPEEAAESTGLDDSARALLEAVDMKSASGVASAFRAMFDACAAEDEAGETEPPPPME